MHKNGEWFFKIPLLFFSIICYVFTYAWMVYTAFMKLQLDVITWRWNHIERSYILMKNISVYLNRDSVFLRYIVIFQYIHILFLFPRVQIVSTYVKISVLEYVACILYSLSSRVWSVSDELIQNISFYKN